MPSLISATHAKNQFSEIVNRVLYGGEEFVVQKQGKPVVKIGPVTIAKDKTEIQDPGIQFLLKLASTKARGLPEDLSKNLNKYAWD